MGYTSYSDTEPLKAWEPGSTSRDTLGLTIRKLAPHWRIRKPLSNSIVISRLDPKIVCHISGL